MSTKRLHGRAGRYRSGLHTALSLFCIAAGANANGFAWAQSPAPAEPPSPPALAAPTPDKEVPGRFPGEEESGPPGYLIGPGDRLRILVRDQPDLSVTIPVRPDGRISLPLVEDLDAADRTAEDVSRSIRDRLAEFVLNPVVSVVVEQAEGSPTQQIRVIGTAIGQADVDAEGLPIAAARRERPRSVPFREGITLLDVIVATGGLSAFASANDAYVIRTVDGTARRIPARLGDLVDGGDVTANLAMAPGDILVIPEGFFTGDWLIVPSLSTALTFTDNVNLAPSRFKESALVATASPGVRIRGETARFRGALDATLDLNVTKVLGENEFDTDEGLDPFLSLLGSSTTELSKNALFLEASASVSEENRDQFDATSLSRFVNTNRETVGVARVSPFWRRPLGAETEIEARYAFNAFARSGVTDSGPFELFGEEGSETYINRAGVTVRTRPQTSDLLLRFDTFGSSETRSDAPSITRAEARLDGEYQIISSFTALASLGYQFRDEEDNDLNDLNDPQWSVGGRWRPSPRLSVEATFGERDGRSNFGGNIAYDYSLRTRFLASYTEQLGTTAEQAASDTAFITTDPLTGEQIDARTGLAFEPTGTNTTIDEETRFTRTFRATGLTELDGNRFRLDALATREETEGPTPDQDRFRLSGSWLRQINPRTRTSVTSFYDNAERGSRTDDTVGVTARVDYSFFTNLTAFALYGFQDRISTSDIFEFRENVFTLGFQGTF